MGVRRQWLAKQVLKCQRILGKLGDVEPRFAESLTMLDSIEAELSEISHLLGSVLDDVEINPNELAAKETRMRELMSAARKYRVEPEQLPEKWAEIQAALHDLEAAADIAALQKTVAQTESAYMEVAQNCLPHATKPRRNWQTKPPPTCKIWR